MNVPAKAATSALCSLAVCCTAWSQTPSPNRQVSGNGAQASFHLGGERAPGSSQEGDGGATDVLIVFNDNAQMKGVAAVLLVQVIETNPSGQKAVFQSSVAPNFLYTETPAALNVSGNITVARQPASGLPQTLNVNFNVTWNTGGATQSVGAQRTYHQPDFHFDENLSGALQLTTVSGTVTVNSLDIPVDSSTPAFWNTSNSRNDHIDGNDRSALSSAAVAHSTTAGYWSGYWTWNSLTSTWFWTWVWNWGGNGWVSS
jgi:hypothetical protein